MQTPKSLNDLLQEYTPLGCDLAVYQFVNHQATAGARRSTYLFVVLDGNAMIYACEIIVDHQKSLTTIYVAKVDTTGCHDRRKSPISGITRAILEYLATSQHGRLRICLFARSQPQYIFPYSSQNVGKHVLDDRSLVRWWAKLFDVLRRSLRCVEANCFLLMPGFEKLEALRHVPSEDYWQIGHPYDLEARATETILAFPDDPKTRFLEDIKADGQDDEITVKQFWEMMAYRQEMSFGHAIGFITLDALVEKVSDYRVDTKKNLIITKTYQKLENALKSEVYSSQQETGFATIHWLALVKQLLPDYEPILVSGRAVPRTNSAGINDDKERAAEVAVNQLEPRKRKKDVSAVNVLVPRKKNSEQKSNANDS